MPFPETERKALLGVKGVGPTVIVRLEQMGLSSLAQLAQANSHDLVSEAAVLVGSNCWKKQPASARGYSNGHLYGASILFKK